MERTIWGMTPMQLYTRYWAAHGVQVVQQGEASQIVKGAELFLLTDPRSLALFKLADLMDALNWINPAVLFVRLHDTRERGYREQVITDASGRFLRFQRLYDAHDSRLGRVVPHPRSARSPSSGKAPPERAGRLASIAKVHPPASTA